MKPTLTERLLRGLYSAILYLLLPVTLYHLVWRGFRQSAYFLRWGERYGFYGNRRDAPTPLWLHAVSVGEVAAAAPLVNALLERHPHTRLLITCITPTGSARIQSLWGGRVTHVYLPYDLPGALRRFLHHFRPERALIMETELWPNLLFGCRDAGIPLAIVNARLSARSLRGYRVLAPLVSRALATASQVCAQSREDAERFIRLGAVPARVSVSGNLKFDVIAAPDAGQLAAQLRTAAGGRAIWIAASTHPDEEAAVLEAHLALRQHFPQLLLLWAPRHPERFRAVSELARAAPLATATRSQHGLPSAADAVFVIDTLGELPRFFAAADVAFVGGSLQAIGGHNLLEPASTGLPIVTGPHLHNFAAIAARLGESGVLDVIDTADALPDAIARWLRDAPARARAAVAARQLVAEGRGALANTLHTLGL